MFFDVEDFAEFLEFA
jgi:hypothetical protein